MKALVRTRSAYRPSTLAAQRMHLRTYLAFVTFMGIQPQFTIQTVLSFLEFLYSNSVSPRVISNCFLFENSSIEIHCSTNWFLHISEVSQ